TIVDLIRNDLSMIAEQVRVKRYRYVDHLTTNRGEILQTSSEITGQLPTDYRENVGTLLFRLLPAGSITGAPKPRTMEIIDEAEGYERGFYTGVMGCYSKGQLDSTVMIRFIDQDKDGQLHYKAGGGITAQSNNNDEYKEVIEKVYVPIY
ncbi:MAG: chorismate-binding protein, partial [Prevotella fusca]|uniref:chorismate-binding protein n=1 Tax=Prevotella fusca TaxID=589436 RepID=UPI003FA106A7